LAAMATVPAWGTATSCPPNPTLQSLAVVLANTSPAGGCVTTDLQFDSFTLGTAAGEVINGITLLPTTTPPAPGTVTPPTTAQIFLTSAPNSADGIQFTSPGPGPGGSCTASGGSLGWCIQGGNQVIDQTITYNVTVLSSAINTIGVDVSITSHSSGQGGAVAAYFREICVGGVFTGSSCGGTEYILQEGGLVGKFQTQEFVQNANTGILPAGTQVQIRDIVYLTTQGATGSFADVDFVSFIDTPEPATFGLMGLALAGLGVLRYRRKA
jgi:hypothetical protein